MANGIRISQAGIPVDQAADYQKTIDERWPIVEYSFQGIIEKFLTDTDRGVLRNAAGTIYHIPIFHHGLGFTPGFRFTQIYAGIDNFGQQLAGYVFADDQDLYVEVFPNPSNSATRFNFKFFLQVFARDLTKSFEAPVDVANLSRKSATSPYGLKIVNSGGANTMNSKDKSQFSLNTNAKSLAYQAHGIKTAEPSGTFAGSLIIPHRLGYPPTYFITGRGTETGIANPSAGKVTTGRFFPGFGIAFSDSVNIRIRGAQAALFGDYLYLILKDPVEFAS